jgi:POT family proton-dependent oligopeptide transporter
MRALFVLYLRSALYSKDGANDIYGIYTGLVYLTPLIGGYISDRYWGNRKSIIVGAILMAIGQFLMFGSALFIKQSVFIESGPIDKSVNNTFSQILLYGALFFIIIGNGFFKPNISTMVGDLYDPKDTRKDSAFTIFYMGINIGAFIAPFVCGAFKNNGWYNPSGYKWGFFCAGIGMILSLTIFIALKDRYLITPEGLGIGLPPNKSELLKEKEEAEKVEEQKKEAEKLEEANGDSDEAKGDSEENKENNEQKEIRKNSPLRIVGSVLIGIAIAVLYIILEEKKATNYISGIIYGFTIGLPIYIITDRNLNSTEKSRIGVIYIIAVFVIFFWSAFEQAGSSLTQFTDDQVDRMIGSFEIKTEWFQSVNPICVVIFAPAMAALWEFLGKRNLEPFSPVKQAIGLALLALGYIVIAIVTYGVGPNDKISMIWIIILYAIHTLGELSLSPIGLSMVNKLSPAHLASLLMGVWFMSNAASNVFAAKLANLIPNSDHPVTHFLGIEISTLTSFFSLFAVMSGVSSIILLALCPLIKKMMKGVY